MSQKTTHTSTVEVLTLPTKSLRVNPNLNKVPMLGTVATSLMSGKTATARQAGADLSAERDALWASLSRDGIIEPIKAHLGSDGIYIVDDGRHRLEWALSNEAETVPVIVVTEAQGSALVESTVIGRRHWTKGQRAYLGVLLHPEVAGCTRGQPKKISDSVGILSATDLAERLGVSPDVVHQAAELYRKFHAPSAKDDSAEAIEAASLKERYEITIWQGCGLGAVLAGIGGGQSTLDKPRPESGFHGLEKPLASLGRFAGLYVKWDADEKAKAMRLMVTRFKADMSPDFRLALSEALAAAEA